MSSIINPLVGNTSNGLSFQATPAQIQQPTTSAQAGTALTNANTGLSNQAGFLQAVQGQNGLGNQSSVYNQLQGVTNGTGPNPAQAALNQNTGANIANQASLMAGQRGSSANAGLIARQAAQQGAATQQQAVGQGATLQANQSLNALNSQGAIANNQAANQAAATNAYSSAAQGEQGTLLNSINAQNQAAVGNQSNVNTVNAGMSGIVAGQQGNLLSGVTSGIGSAAGMIPSLFGGGSMSTGAPIAGAGSSLGGDAIGGTAGSTQNLIGAGALVSAKGGKVPKMMADGGNTAPAYVPQAVQAQPLQQAPQYTPPSIESGPQSNVGQYMMTNSAPASTPAAKAKSSGVGMPDLSSLVKEGSLANNIYQGGSKLWSGIGGIFDSGGTASLIGGGAMDAGAVAAPVVGDAAVTAVAAKGGRAGKTVPALVSPGEQYLPPQDVEKVKKGANPLAVGERIPGTPKVKGNSYANDIVPKKLEAGGIVIPNSIMQGKNPHWGAMKFVQAHMAQGGLVPKLPKKAKK
jgi:hypothetical protein